MNSKLLNHIIPSKIEVALSAILAIIISFLGNTRELIELLFAKSGAVNDNEGALGIMLAPVKFVLSTIDNLSFAPNLVLMIFWGFIGVIVYSFISTIVTIGREVSEDIEIATHYAHPKHYARVHVLIEAVVYSLRNLLVFLLFSVGFYGLLKFSGPLAVVAFMNLFDDLIFVNSIVYLFSVIILSFWITAIIVLSRRFFEK